MEVNFKEIWAIVVVIVSVIIWLVRLEAKVIYLESIKNDLAVNLKALSLDQDDLKSRMFEQLSSIKETLIKLELSLKYINKEDLK